MHNRSQTDNNGHDNCHHDPNFSESQTSTGIVDQDSLLLSYAKSQGALIEVATESRFERAIVELAKPAITASTPQLALGDIGTYRKGEKVKMD